jgi:hypothetical protein
MQGLGMNNLNETFLHHRLGPMYPVFSRRGGDLDLDLELVPRSDVALKEVVERALIMQDSHHCGTRSRERRVLGVWIVQL